MSGPSPAARPVDARLVPAALAVWVTCGVAVGLEPRTTARALVVVAGGTLVAVVAVRWFARPHGRHRRDLGARAWAAILLLGTCVLAAGALSAAGVEARTSGIVGEAVRWDGSVEVRLRVLGRAEPLDAGSFGGGERFTVRAVLETVTLRGRPGPSRAPVLVLADAGWSAVERGALVDTRGRLLPAEPGDDVVALLAADRPPEVVTPPGVVDRAAARLRTTLLGATSSLAPHARGLLPGIAVGDDSRMPPTLEQDMRTASLAHLVAVSGAHVAIVLGAVLALTTALPRGVRIGVGGAALAGLVVLVGPEPSVLRASAMGVVTLGAFLLRRPSRALPALAVAVIVLLLADPWASRSFGFALSVCATAGLVLLAGPWTRALASRMPTPLAAALAIPAAAQAACAPVVVLLDPGVPAYGILANALVAPVVAPVTVLTLLATLAGPWWPGLAHVGLVVAQAGTWWVERVATWVALAPGARLPWPGGVGGAVALAALEAGLLALLASRLARARLAAAARASAVPGLAAALVLTLAAAIALTVPATREVVAPWVRRVLPASWPPAGWRLVQCDVGQGSALVLASGRTGHAVMVDVGPADGSGAACLRSLGIRVLDLLVVTHADADHVGGLDAVLGAVDVESAMVGPYDDGGRDDAVRELLTAVGARIMLGSTDSPDVTGQVGDVMWQVLWPTPRSTQLAGAEAANDQSVTVRFVVGSGDAALHVLVHGDPGAEAQAALARAFPPGGALDVVVVPHHGSPDQDAGMAALTPARLALVSVGADNDYGHPAEATLDLYRDAGAVVARTDICGPIAVVPGAGGGLRLAGCPP
ncbi:ComEC/Rec2-related protein protein [Beutenbergia cavernae DSM 12333]|uniref:ComEC/Rec2-related protein protein n=1 Tax=Beutenbergia cavernae (strain ATCC BAA-8 / DSM 12333 / CCUG 43141 / JCM 11478 / NBRC 16432 / NCIMB 13614 / HKI 0122) TaxID=471853 RepID=C5C481_BEUC1|nr:ComEC/Rec2 family competence protein [Beutenbergia cavernae]ACQ79994.1 ComEC/Rec2-related protein protein [Beutenbergia cavernae DSM 12333]